MQQQTNRRVMFLLAAAALAAMPFATKAASNNNAGTGSTSGNASGLGFTVNGTGNSPANNSNNSTGTGTNGGGNNNNNGTTNNANNSGTNNGNNGNNNNNNNNDNAPYLILRDFSGTNFLAMAAADDLLEVQLGWLAQTNSSNSEVQQFGEMLVNDHTTSFEETQTVASNAGVTLRPLNNQEKGVVRYFKNLTGAEFDRIFIRYSIKGHVADISRHEVAALRANNYDVRKLAANDLPVLQKHLLTALDIRESLLGNAPLSQ